MHALHALHTLHACMSLHWVQPTGRDVDFQIRTEIFHSIASFVATPKRFVIESLYRHMFYHPNTGYRMGPPVDS